MIEFLQYAGLIVLYIVIFASDVAIFVGIPGGWIAFGIIFIFDLANRFSVVGWGLLLVMLGMVVVGEIAESFLGVVYVHQKGASGWGVFGAFLGGILGAVLGSFIMPVAGSIIFAFVGAFALAILFEYLKFRSMDKAVQTGFSAFVGKIAAMMVKFALACAVAGMFIVRSWGSIG